MLQQKQIALTPLVLDSIATPAAPPANSVELYGKSDGNLYQQASAGGEQRVATLALAAALALALG